MIYTTKIFAAQHAASSGLPLSRFLAFVGDWRAVTDPCSKLLFGKSVPTKIPLGRRIDLMHTHLMPGGGPGDPDYDDWLRKLRSKTVSLRCKRESNNLMFHVESTKHGLLLISYGTHATMNSSATLAKMVETGEQWATTSHINC